jgi:hypothetical protein
MGQEGYRCIGTFSFFSINDRNKFPTKMKSRLGTAGFKAVYRKHRTKTLAPSAIPDERDRETRQTDNDLKEKAGEDILRGDLSGHGRRII